MKELDNLFKHLLYDDSRKILFCYVPKNGCSNLKRMMLILNGFLPPNASLDRYSRPSEELLGSVSMCVINSHKREVFPNSLSLFAQVLDNGHFGTIG